jgi:hypothetical protein
MAMTVKECQAMIDLAEKIKIFGHRIPTATRTQYKRIQEDRTNGLLGKSKTVECAAGYSETRTDH